MPAHLPEVCPLLIVHKFYDRNTTFAYRRKKRFGLQ